ncbi:MAG: hypothetical protein KDA17_07245 [Candidatus Saccharibacteria bacterium]|nr:hypothetical protein [Candidatus Saccharibacteria bacterium]
MVEIGVGTGKNSCDDVVAIEQAKLLVPRWRVMHEVHERSENAVLRLGQLVDTLKASSLSNKTNKKETYISIKIQS